MPRQYVIKIKTEIVIPYDRKKFGEATRAEGKATEIQHLLAKIEGAETVKFGAEQTSIEGEKE